VPNLWTGPLRRAQVPPRSASTSVPWREATYIAIDLETTGLDPRRDHIVSYGAVPVREGRVRIAESVYGLVHVPCEVPAEAIKCHGIRTQDVATAPPLADCVQRLHALIDGHIVVAHGAWIERGFLHRAFRRCNLRFAPAMVDTAVLARRFLDLEGTAAADPGYAVSLEYAARALRLPVHSPHHALGDAMTTAGLFITLAGRLGRDTSTATLLSLSR
jgi:DNA polymerase III subunit epsilon